MSAPLNTRLMFSRRSSQHRRGQGGGQLPSTRRRIADLDARNWSATGSSDSSERSTLIPRALCGEDCLNESLRKQFFNPAFKLLYRLIKSVARSRSGKAGMDMLHFAIAANEDGLGVSDDIADVR